MKWTTCLMLVFCPVFLFAQEICDNGIDDDGDSLVDANDLQDCSCSGIFEEASTAYISNPSFEDYSTCPTANGQYSYLEDWWAPPNTPNNNHPDYLNTCGNEDGFLTKPTTSLPDGDGFIGLWGNDFNLNEYIATCLNSPLSAFTSYSFSIDIGFGPTWPWSDTTCIFKLYGNSSCNTNTTVDYEDIDGSGWNLLGSAQVSGSDDWKTLNLSIFSFSQVNALLLSTNGTIEGGNRYFFLDNIILTESSNDEIPISATIIYKDPCNLIDTLKSTTLEGAIYQWYKNGIALIGETDSFLVNVAQNYGLGNYQVRVDEGNLNQCSYSSPILFGHDETNAYNFALDTTFCKQTIVDISIDETYGSIEWSTGMTSPNISIDTEDTYAVTVTYDGNCTISDSLVFDSIPRLETTIYYRTEDELDYSVYEGETIYTCPNDSLFFIGSLNEDLTYIWTNMNSLSCQFCDSVVLNAANSGYLFLQVATLDCNVKDTVNISLQEDHNNYFDTLICANQSIDFNDSTYNFAGDSVLYHVFTNINGCDSIVVLNVTIKDSIAADWEIIIDSCSSACTSIIIQTDTDGIPPIDHQWSNGSNGINQFELCAGNYNVSMTDAIGCQSTFYFEIPEITPIAYEVLVSDYNGFELSCHDSNDGTATITYTGSATPISLEWADGNLDSIRTNLDAGTYAFQLTDANNCLVTDSISLLAPAALTTNISQVQSLTCFQSQDGAIGINTSGGVEPYSYTWFPAASNQAIAIQLAAGDYFITIEDENGCLDSITTILTEPEPILAHIDVSDVSCFGFIDGTIQIDSIANGIRPFTYRLNDGALQFLNTYPATINYLSPDIYTLSIKDSADCSYSEVITIGSPDSLSLVYEPQQDTVISLGQPLYLSAYSYNNSANIQWSDNIDCIDCKEQLIYPTENMTVNITAIDTSSGCFKDASFYINVLKERPVYIPNVFSPNEDGENDRFIIFAREKAIVSIDEISIFNRFGATIYTKKNTAPNDYSSAWDGTFRGEDAPIDVYTYFVTLTFIDGKQYTLEGEVSLVR